LGSEAIVTNFEIGDLVTVKKGTSWVALAQNKFGAWVVTLSIVNENLFGKVTGIVSGSILVFVGSTNQHMAISEKDILLGQFHQGV